MLSLLKELCDINGVCGEEDDALKFLEKEFSGSAEIIKTPLNSIVIKEKTFNEKLPTIMLEAHIDRIGFIVTNINEDGFLKVEKCGGIDIRATLGSPVSVCAKDENIKGVICSYPHHGQNKTLPLKANKLYIDVGLTKKEAEEKISIGDKAFLKSDLCCLINNNVTASSLDNRAGCASIIKAAKLLKTFEKANLALCFSSQEEIGGSGAKTAVSVINPDYAIVVDVSFADTPIEPHDDCQKLEKGPMIGLSPVLSKELSNHFVKIAEREKIPYQKEVMSGRTGTDADSIITFGRGVKTALISIPLRYMHTPCEVINIDDINNTAILIAKAVEKLV